MFKLIIKDKGFLINLPGITPFRTPATLLIRESEIKRIEIGLRKMGIQNFEIKPKNIEQTKKKTKSVVKKIVEKITGTTVIKETVDISQINKRFDNIESLLKGMINKPGEVHIVHEPGEVHKKDDFNTTHDFIPTVDTSDVKVGGSTEYSRVEDEKEEDLEKKSKSLSKLTRDKKFKK